MTPALPLICALLGAATLTAADLSLPTQASSAGATLTMPVTLSQSGGLTALQFDLEYNQALLTANPSPGPTATAAGKTLSTAVLPNGRLRVVVSGLNQTPIADGIVVSISFTISTAATAGTYPLTLSGTLGTNANSQVIQVAALSGAINLGGIGNITTALRFVPLTPCRVMDTRPGGGKGGQYGPPTLSGGTFRTVNIPQSGCGVPATAQAFSMNITVVPPGPLSYLSIWPAGQPQPTVSTLNSFDGRVIANAAIVPAGTGGAINVFVSNTSDVIADINGYFVPVTTPSSLSFYSVTPCRVMDTRTGAGTAGAFGPPTPAGGSTRSVPIPSSNCGVPATAQAYSLNVTVVPRSVLSYLSIWPTGQAQPVVSTLNSFDGAVVANAAIVPAGAGGAINLFVTDTADLIVDINGYFAAPGAPDGLSFYTLNPCRVADSRLPAGTFGAPALAAGTTRSFPIPGSGCGAPTTSRAYSLNFTVVPQGPLSYLSAWPTGLPQPLVSTLNSFAGKVVANAALVPAGSSQAVNVFVTNTTDVILDINGYFAP